MMVSNGELGATPRPWSEFCESDDWWIGQKEEPDFVVCSANDMTTADMLLIVKAVNAHDELPDLIQALVDALARAITGKLVRNADELLSQARAILGSTPAPRVEHRTVLANELIREAVAITKGLWGPLPADGFYTTVNPEVVGAAGSLGIYSGAGVSIGA